MIDHKPGWSQWVEKGIRGGWIGDYEQGLLTYVDQEFAPVPSSVETVLVFTSLFLKSGHVCLPLDRTPEEWFAILDLELKERVMPPSVSLDEIATFPATGGPGDNTLFILENNRFFFRRNWYYEMHLANLIRERANMYVTVPDPRIVKKLLAQQFPDNNSSGDDKQKLAAVLSLLKQFLVISGGPGTGKTTTLGKILTLHLGLAGKPLRVALAAPTGKAANRMTTAIHRSFDRFGWPPELDGQSALQAMTLHRLLGSRRHSNLLPEVNFTPLPFDLIIVDEASMIDLSLMFRLVGSMAPTTRLILLGDKDQLSSVEAGAVFVELCRSSSEWSTPGTVEYLKRTGITPPPPASGETVVEERSRPSIVVLDKNYRFSPNSGIERLKTSIQQSKISEACKLFDSHAYEDLFYKPFNYSEDDLRMLCRTRAGLIKTCRNTSPEHIFDIWSSGIWLSVRRNGPYGSNALNRMIEDYLIREKIVKPVYGWYTGRPVLITRNDYSLGLFNGDLGICQLDEQGIPWVWFPNPGDGFKKLHTHNLGEFEPAFIMTVHKSQGSEFKDVTLLLPEKSIPILTKDLIYTAVTRASGTFTLAGDPDLLKEGLNRESARFSTLGEKLWGNDKFYEIQGNKDTGGSFI